jgi:hypothetical protein
MWVVYYFMLFLGGIRLYLMVLLLGLSLFWIFGLFFVLAFPCFVFGLLVLPLCGAALTSLCRPQREVSKRKRLKPLVLKRGPRTATVVVHLESGFSHIRRS